MSIVKDRVIIGEFQKFQDKALWLAAVAEREADKILMEDPNPVYHNLAYAALRGNGKIVGHWNPKAGEGHAYSSAMNFRTTRRKFKAVWINKIHQETNTIRVEGSKGNIYEVAKDGSNCTCPGFTFRGKCKHVTAQRNEK
jgi:hypothetical protein